MKEKKYSITEDELRKLHHTKELTPGEIADYYGCSRSLIYHYFRKFDIEKKPKYERLKGKKFGRLTVIELSKITENDQAEWICKCDCGNKIKTTTAMLKFGTTKSCGCLREEKITKHEMSDTRPYRIWLAMKSRCDNPNSFNYNRYGGRGIAYTDEWSEFENFWEDMSEGYSENLTLERIDNEENYNPENCRWATVEEQNRNKRNSVRLTLGDKTKTASEWVEIKDIPLKTLYERAKQGWSDERVLTQPPRG